MPRGGWLREVRRWACCGLRRTGGPSPGFGAFSSSPYTVPLCWVWGPGIAVLWSCQRIDVCDSVRLLYLLTYLQLIRGDCKAAWAGAARDGLHIRHVLTGATDPWFDPWRAKEDPLANSQYAR